MKNVIAVALLIALSSPAHAWNERGHMVIARLTWRQLSEEQRAKVSAILKQHPHYDQYLAARRPEGFTEQEWVFMRAATWPDWIRGRQPDYDRPVWHYINYPIVPPGSAVDPKAHEPLAKQENIVNQLGVCMDKLRNGSDQDKAVYMTWLFHLVGDIHQPLHCTAVFSERFPMGDRGGNSALVRIRTDPVNLHSFWDGLLGTGATVTAIGNDVREIESVMKDKAEDVRKELNDHKSFESWAREGLELSRRVVYLNCELKVAVSGNRGEDVPLAPPDYAPNCGKVARVQVGKAGMRLTEQLRTLFP